MIARRAAESPRGTVTNEENTVTGATGHRPVRVPDIRLSMDEIRAVTAFNLACAVRVVGVFEDVRPDDDRPRRALAAAEEFARGGPRSRAQRVAAPAAHRAAKEVPPAAFHAAMAAGDAAASAYLHPLADAAQVGHILRGPAHALEALRLCPADPLTREDAEAVVLGEAGPTVVAVLCRYPRAETSGRGASHVMAALDARLRAG